MTDLSAADKNPAQHADTGAMSEATEPVAYEDLDRCPFCGAHLIGDREPVNITVIGGQEQWVPGDHHICRGGARNDGSECAP